MRRVVIRLDDDLHRRLRFMSLETEEPLQRIAVRLLRAEVERYDAKKKARRR
jgi:predicted transcriptional regulator